MDTPSNPTEYRYSAFISYRHVEPDRRWAKWLHSALEIYRIPKRIGNKRKVGRIFRDEEELPASADLSSEIAEALIDSEFLIVVCSPRTPASQWVNKEVETFRELGRHDRILVLLIEGEPSDSFPVALHEIRRTLTDGKGSPTERIEEVEPLAADVRPSRVENGRHLKRMAKLRLLACVLRVRFDDLRGRDQERRNRSLALACTFMTSLAVGAAMLTAFALHEKTVAELATSRAYGEQSKTKHALQEVENQRNRALMEQQKTATALAEAERLRIAAQSAETETNEQRRRAQGVNAFLQLMLHDPSDPTNAGMKETAGDMLKHAEMAIPTAFPGDPALEASTHNTLGRTYENLNLFEAAEAHDRKGLEICQTKLGYSNPQTAQAVAELVELFDDEGKYSDAQNVLADNVGKIQKAAPWETREIGLLTLCQADLLVELGKPDEALPLLRSTLLWRVDAAVDALPALGLAPFRPIEPLRSNPELLAEANKAYADSYAIHLQTDGESATVTLVTAYLLADSSLMLGDYVTARHTFEWLLPKARNVLGADHRFTFYIVRGLTETLDASGSGSDADKIYDALVDQRTKDFGTDAPVTLATIAMKLNRLERLGRYDQSSPMRSDLLERQKRLYGDIHPETIDSIYAYGLDLLATHHEQDARRLFADARKSAFEQLGAGSKVVKQFDVQLMAIDLPIEPIGKWSCEVVSVVGLAQYRASKDSPWQKLTPGLELAPGSEFRTGPRSSLGLRIGKSQTITLDRLGVITLEEAIRENGKYTADMGMKYGHTRYDIEGAGEHEFTVKSPNGTLVVRD